MKNSHANNIKFYRDKRVLVTGHTGFKGAWLTVVLNYLNAVTTGYALKAEKGSLFEKIDGYSMLNHIEGDIRDYKLLEQTIREVKPEIVFHLAALAQVKDCYEDPIRAYSTNLMGTVNLLESLKNSNVKSIVIITTDKVYENKGDGAVYKETDLLGGSDPYATSKTSIEFAVKAYRESYFEKSDQSIGVATVRASNVLAGGDHIKTRLIPSILDSVSKGETLEIRNPNQTRPWQSVLDALNGYLTVGRYIYNNPLHYSGGWNIGPTTDSIRTVSWIVDKIKEYFEGINSIVGERFDVKESETLGLDIKKALSELDWEPRMSCEKVIQEVVDFYIGQIKGIKEKELCEKQVKEFFEG